ncbi:MAG: hypothetical protein ACOYBM_02835 [Dethiobacteria bacterium]|jgi:hypothetical protein
MAKLNQQLTRREKILLTIAFVGIITAIFWHSYLGSALSSYHEIRKQKGELCQRLADAQEYLQRKEVVEEEFASLRLETEKPAILLPGELPLAMGELQLLLEETAVSLETLNIGTYQELEAFKVLSLFLQVSGKPEELHELVTKLEDFPHLLLIEGVSWQRLNHDLQERQLEIKAQLVMSR